MLKRCIMIFPKFDNVEIIDEVRDKYDPLAKHVRPHITLIFPFDSDIETEDLKEHISSVLKDTKTFEIVLKGITAVKSFGNYLFLGIQVGSDEIIQLHEKLYTGILKKYYPEWLKDGYFMPHMTVGRLDDDESFKVATEESKDIDDFFKAIVNEISVEIIDKNEDSIIELKVPLN